MDEGCKHLSEESQSDIALHITNCFLEMSGHETYNCELDKKSNLRAICINSMSDRAYNVYTEFFTHTQNICWFLQGQIWQEAISENTWKVGKQLELTALNQEGLLQAQKESLELQERMLKQGRNLEHVLESLHASSNAHQNILMMLSKSVNNLQSWIIGEVSWIDSVVFYMMSVFVMFLLTSSQRTLPSRLPISVLLFFNLLFERMICSFITTGSKDLNISSLYIKIYDFIWYSRYCFVGLAFVIFLYKAVYHSDIHFKNNDILNKIHNQTGRALNDLEYLKCKLVHKSNDELIIENNSLKDPYKLYLNGSPVTSNGSDHTLPLLNNINSLSSKNEYYSENNITKDSNLKNLNNSINKYRNEIVKNSYNLRSNSRQATPDC